MKPNRIFIENLPETVSEAEIRSKFENFGDVTSIDIKERKVVTIKHTSCFFAYVNLTADETSLQKCFQTFNETPWCGEYVTLKIAKESFLERLKRERETNLPKDEPKNSQVLVVESTQVPYKSEDKNITCDTKKKTEVILKTKVEHKGVKRERKISSSSSDSSEEEVTTKTQVTRSLDDNKKEPKNESIVENILNKNRNRGAKFVNGLLKIEDFGKGPIKPVDNQKILDKHQAEAEIRRKKALDEKRKDYRQRKNAFSLFRKNPKIIKFTDDDMEENEGGSENKKKNSNKLTLFDNSDSDTDNFDIKKNIENKIKSDERFVLDHRFSKDQEGEIGTNQEKDEYIQEKEKGLQILEEVLGQKMHLKQKSTDYGNAPRYIRYDPSNPQHVQYELKDEQQDPNASKKKKRVNEKKTEEKQAPEVSKERLHSVKVDLKAALGQSGDFSIRELYGDIKTDEGKSMEEEAPIPLGGNKFCLNEKNPYKYDSSDDEDETEPLKQEEKPQAQKIKKVWTEPFFFQENDFRFQEGLDFVKRIAAQAKGGDFDESRKQLKDIVKKKIRNAKRKNKPFQRKLGGSKKKKAKRWDKALKR